MKTEFLVKKLKKLTAKLDHPPIDRTESGNISDSQSLESKQQKV